MSFQVILETPRSPGKVEKWEMKDLLEYRSSEIADWFFENDNFDLQDFPTDLTEESETEIQFRGQEQIIVLTDRRELDAFWNKDWSEMDTVILGEIREAFGESPSGSRLLIFRAPSLRNQMQKATFNPIAFLELVTDSENTEDTEEYTEETEGTEEEYTEEYTDDDEDGEEED